MALDLSLSPYGQYGNLFSYVSPEGSGRWETPTPGWTPQNSGLPDYLASQFYQGQVHSGGDGDQQSTQWQLQGGGGGGGVSDRNGNNVIQVGDPKGWGQGDSVKDRSKVRYDPDLGYVTDRSNIHDTYIPDKNPWLHIAEIWAAGAALGAGGAAMGLGGEAAGTGAGITGGIGAGEAGASGAGVFGSGAGAAGAGAGAGSMTGLAGDESAGLSMGPGAAGDESAGLSMNNPFGGGGFDANGNWSDLSSFNGSPTNLPTVDTSGLPTYNGGGSSLLHQLNTGRQYFNGARSVMNLLSGGQGQAGQRSGGMGSTDLSSLISSLFGGGNGGGLAGGLLGLLANGHSMFGGGIGTASGAQAAADKASGMADPWGQSGRRGQFNDLLTPDRAMALMSQDPSQVLNNPAYQFDLKQGTNAINMGDAAQGTLRSGNRGYELQDYGQGLAAKYGQQYFNNNMTTLNALSGLAGVNASSPTAAGQMQMNGFDNASNIRNAGVNSLFGGGSSNPLMGGLGSLLSSLGGAGSSLMNLLSGNGGFDMSNVDFGNLPAFNDTSGWDPSQFFNYDDGSGSLADATGAFF